MHAALQTLNPVQQAGLVVDENLELVKRIAWRLHQRLPDCVQIEDLIQAGTIGLLEAWERYQPGEQASFSTFPAFVFAVRCSMKFAAATGRRVRCIAPRAR